MIFDAFLGIIIIRWINNYLFKQKTDIKKYKLIFNKLI